jgi:hypothetical protein
LKFKIEQNYFAISAFSNQPPAFVLAPGRGIVLLLIHSVAFLTKPAGFHDRKKAKNPFKMARFRVWRSNVLFVAVLD